MTYPWEDPEWGTLPDTDRVLIFNEYMKDDQEWSVLPPEDRKIIREKLGAGAIEPTAPQLTTGEKVAGAVAKIPGAEWTAERAQEALTQGGAGLWSGVAGRVSGLQRLAGETPEEGAARGSLVEKIRQYAAERAGKLQQATGPTAPTGVGGEIATGVMRAPLDILGMGPELAVLGSVGGFAAHSGGQAYGAGAPPETVALEAGKGALMGKALGLAGKLPAAARVPAMAAVGGGMAAAEGAPPRKIAASAGVMGTLGLAGRYRRWTEKGLPPQEALRRAVKAEEPTPEAALADLKSVAPPVERRQPDAAYLRQIFDQMPEDRRLGGVQDAVTGVANRNALDYHVEKNPEWHNVMFDMKGFKDVNDAYGHKAGDEVLKYVSGIMREEGGAPEATFLARYGGDEFVARSGGIDATLDLASRVSKRLENHTLTALDENGNRVDITLKGVRYGEGPDLDTARASLKAEHDRTGSARAGLVGRGAEPVAAARLEVAGVPGAGRNAAVPETVAPIPPAQPVGATPEVPTRRPPELGEYYPPITEPPKPAPRTSRAAPELGEYYPPLEPKPGELGAATDPISAALSAVFGSKQRADTVAVPSQFKEVEQRWTEAQGIRTPGALAKAKIALVKVKNAFARHFPYIDPKESPAHAQSIDILRQQEAVPEWSKVMAFDTIHEITRDLGPKRADLFTRALVLPDILKDVEAGLYSGKDLPFGYKAPADVQTDLARFNQAISLPENAPIRDALTKRQALVRGVTEQLVSQGLLTEEALKDPRYYHRQVLLKMQEKPYVGVSGGDVRLHRKGFQKERIGGGDFNTRYHEAEFEWLAQAYSLLRTKKLQAQLQGAADISEKLKAEAKQTGTDWKKLVPEGYVVWQPKEGSIFYKALTIQEKVLDKIISGEKSLEFGDVKEALAVGGRRQEWVLPGGIAKTLDNFRSFDEAPLERLAASAQSTWKQWVLLNPLRIVKYNLNNISGDLDIALAYSPRILKNFPRAASELWAYQVRRNASPEVAAKMRDLVGRRVVGSGLTVAEIPDINKEGAFRVLIGDNPNLIQQGAQRYWGGVKNFTVWRENILRVAAYDHFLSELKAGKKVYGASDPKAIDAIPDIKDRAAKLATELIGDYGNVSSAGIWLRRHLIPFYSWLEINAPRYVKMLRNMPAEARGAGAAARVAGVTAKKIGTLAVKANIMFGLVYLWNKAMFPEEEKLLRRNTRGKPVIILGKTDDGQIRSLRFEGALADALDWFGLGNYPVDIEEVAKGKATVGEKAAEAVKAPIEKIVQGWEPFSKTTFEVALGKSTYPKMFEEGASFGLRGAPIRDRMGHVARVFSLDGLWNIVTNKPRPRGSMFREDTPKAKSSGAALLDAVATYKTDPGEASYYVIRDKASGFLEQTGRGRAAPGDFTDRQNALYYYKKARQWGDKERESHWLKKYQELGGSARGLEQSIRLSSPIGLIPQGLRGAFINSLDQRERDVLRLAIEWYNKSK